MRDFITPTRWVLGLALLGMLAEASMLVALTVHHGSGTEACLDQEHLARSVEKRLKRRVFVTRSEADLRFVVTFTKAGAAIEARIAIASVDGTPRGTRTLVTEGHCSALDDSLALSLALLADQPPDPDPEAEPLPPEPGEAPPTPPPAATTTAPESAPPVATAPATPPRKKPAPAAITIPRDVAAPREPWHLRFGAVAAGSWGTLPGLAPSFALYLRLVPRGFSPILVQGEGFLPRTAARNEHSGARLHLLRSALAICPPLTEQLEFAASVCVGQKIGWITAAGYGFDHDHVDHRVTYSLSAGADARLRLFAPVSLRGYLGAEVPLTRDGFASTGDNAVQLFKTTAVAACGEIGLEAALW